jgi:hypothetical protein
MNKENAAPLRAVPSNFPARTLTRSDIEAMAKRVCGVCEFFFCAPSLPITGGVGSPINPIIVK